jgi:NAD(P)H-quinone oxidoreductase subunit 5
MSLKALPSPSGPLPPSPARLLPASGGLWLLLAAAIGSLTWAAAHESPATLLGLRVDRVTSTIALLVTSIGLVAFRYAGRCLRGDRRQVEFQCWMAATVACAFALSLADALPLLVIAWIAVGTCLDRLLRFFTDRPEAIATARRMLTLSRVGDVLMIAACLVAWRAWGSSTISDVAATAPAAGGSPALATFALVLCVAVAIKSAQVPMHQWLPDTTEAPTPVSALLHAGIVNAGGALLIRLAPVIECVPEAWLLLSACGTMSIVATAPATWFHARVKTALAWSTVSQMGFMLVQCALLAFPAALLHILGHGLYKAWSFMRSGEPLADTPSTAPTAQRAIALLAVGTALSAISLAAWSNLFELAREPSPGKLALLAIVALASGQCWVALLGRRRARRGSTIARICASVTMTIAAPALACAAYSAGSWWMGPMKAAVHPQGAAAWIAAILPVAAVAILAAIHAALPALEGTRVGSRLRVHAASGFYVGIAAQRLIDRVFHIIRTTPTGVSRA